MDQSNASPFACENSMSSDGIPFPVARASSLPFFTTSHSIRRKTQIHLRSTSAISSQKMTALPSDCEYRWLDSLMDHVIRRMKFRKMAMGYTGRGYRSTARSPYGCEAPRRPVALSDEDVWSSEDKDSCDLLDDAALNCREGNWDPSLGMVEREVRRSRPQSLVKSHQNEYDELITADISLIEC